MAIRCVVFDFDGTIIRSNRIKRQALYEVTKDIRGAAEMLDRMHEEGLPGDRYDIFRELCCRLGRAGYNQAGHLVMAYTGLCRSRLASCEHVPGAIEAISTLSRAGVALYIASATPQRELRDIVSVRGIEHFFAGILGRPTGKADHLRRVLAQRILSPAQLLVVGDGVDDQTAAAGAGCRFVGVLDDPISPPVAADAFVQDLHDLPSVIDGLSGSSDRRDQFLKEDC